MQGTVLPFDPARRVATSNPEPVAGKAAVLALNDPAVVFETLAREIRGSAVGWPDAHVARLEEALFNRYGQVLGGRQAVRRLVRLARDIDAA